MSVSSSVSWPGQRCLHGHQDAGRLSGTTELSGTSQVETVVWPALSGQRRDSRLSGDPGWSSLEIRKILTGVRTHFLQYGDW